MIKINIIGWFKKWARNDCDVGDIHELDYFECDDDVEAALNYLDNHPHCTFEEYEQWLDHRDNAMKERRKNGN